MTLELLDVHPEALHDISEADAAAEGGDANLMHELNGPTTTSAREGLRFLWDSINKKRGCGWDVNPWVWALTFRMLADAELN